MIQNKKLVELQFPISKDAWTKIWLIGEVTQESIDKLVEILLLQKDAFPTKEPLAFEGLNGWTPIETLPEKDGEYLVTCKFTEAGKENFGKDKSIETRNFSDGVWDFIHPNFGKFVAWRPLPEAYKG